MFRRYLTLVEDNVMVVLSQGNSYKIMISASYTKSGRRGTRCSHYKSGVLLSACFGTGLIVNGHTFRSENSQNRPLPSGEGGRIVINEIAKLVKQYLISSLGLEPCHRRGKHSFEISIVVYTEEPLSNGRCELISVPLIRINSNAISWLRSILATKSKVSFDKFLMDRNNSVANLYLPSPGVREIK